MRVLFFSNIYPNPWEPLRGSYNRALVAALSKRHAVHVISPVAWTRELGARRRGVTLPPARRIAEERWNVDYPRYYYPPKALRAQYGGFMWWSVRPTAFDALVNFRPDVIVADWAHPDGDVAGRLARAAGVPSVVIVGGSDALVLTGARSRRRSVLGALSRADLVATVSEDIRRALIEQGLDSARLACVYRGVDLDTFSPGDRAAARARLALEDVSTLFWAGNFVAVKDLDVLLDAAALLRASGRPFRLYLAGRGPLESDLKLRAAALDLEDRVTFIGPVANAALADWYRAADLTVMSSRSEGIPNVLLESISCGTRFVSSRVGGIPEIADPALDRLVDPGNPAALARAIDASLEDIRQGRGGTRRKLPSSADAAAERFGELFEMLRRGAAVPAAFAEAVC